VAPKDRDIAMVFQSYALYPTCRTYENMAFALSLRHMPKATISEKVRRAAEKLGITQLLDKRPASCQVGNASAWPWTRHRARPAVFSF